MLSKECQTKFRCQFPGDVLSAAFIFENRKRVFVSCKRRGGVANYYSFRAGRARKQTKKGTRIYKTSYRP